MPSSKQRNRTTEELYWQLIHDPRFSSRHELIIGYHDRIRGPMETSLSSFRPIRDGGDIPFHRLRYFRHPRLGLIFDKDTKIDALLGRGPGGGGAAAEVVCEGEDEGWRGVVPPDSVQEAIDAAARNAAATRFLEEQRLARKKQRWHRGGSAASKSMKGGGLAAEGGSGGGSMFHECPVFRFTKNGQWEEVLDFEAAASSVAPRKDPSLVVVTYNVLFGHFLKAQERAEAPQRTRALFKVLRAQNADVISLQEVTPPFLDQLLSLPWIRRSYWATASPTACDTVSQDGQLLLTRLPPEAPARIHYYSNSKKAVMASLVVDYSGLQQADGAGGGVRSLRHRVLAAALHLTSDYKASPGTTRAKLRDAQLQVVANECERLIAAAPAQPTSILFAGDFNTADESENLSSLLDFEDCGKNSGYTYDPTTNPLAYSHAPPGRKHIRKRCDRIYVQTRVNGLPSSSLSYQAEWAERLGTSPIQPKTGSAVFPSDHFGVATRLRLSLPNLCPPPPPPLHPAAVLEAAAADEALVPPQIPNLQRQRSSEGWRLLREAMNAPTPTTIADYAGSRLQQCVYILRGIPGSGKSTTATAIASRATSAGKQAEICSADLYFMNKITGEYKWRADQLGEAHRRCFESFEAALHKGVPIIIVDNCNRRRRDYRPYVEAAKAAGARYRILQMECKDLATARELGARTVHGVALRTVERIYEAFEPDAEAVLVHTRGSDLLPVIEGAANGSGGAEETGY